MTIVRTSALALGLSLLTGIVTSIPAQAQSYSAPGNNPVGRHTYLGDYPIDPRDGGTICYGTPYGPRCVPVERAVRRPHRTARRAHHRR